MTTEQRIIDAITGQSLERGEIARIIGYDALRTMCVLKKMRERGEVVLTGDGSYQASEAAA